MMDDLNTLAGRPIYIWLAENGNIRKWSFDSFDQGVIYYPSAGSDFALADIECGPIPLGMAPKHVAALLREIARIANDHDLREEISEVSDSYIWRDCIEHADRVADAIEARAGAKP